jgi:UDP-2,3-diacylglucosamine hydrolase
VRPDPAAPGPVRTGRVAAMLAGMSERSVVFLSDAHLGVESSAREADRTARLHAFLASLPGRASELYIVGDLFDFWFEYGTAIPRRFFPTLTALQRLREAGVAITYLNGNHDFWLGTFFRDTLGIRTVDGGVTVEAQGRRLFVHHGDGLVGGDLGYKLLRGILRSRACIGLYGLLHPDLGIPLALAVSRWSRHSRPDGPLRPDRLWREIAEPRFASGHDAVLVGHFHEAYERREDGREFFVLGDWIGRFTYAELRDGRIELRTWTGRD